jgi:hypothetical protein
MIINLDKPARERFECNDDEDNRTNFANDDMIINLDKPARERFECNDDEDNRTNFANDDNVATMKAAGVRWPRRRQRRDKVSRHVVTEDKDDVYDCDPTADEHDATDTSTVNCFFCVSLSRDSCGVDRQPRNSVTSVIRVYVCLGK